MLCDGDMFSSIEAVTAGISICDGCYLPSREIAIGIYLSDQLEKPILVEGPAGVGKTELARAVAKCSGRELLRLQCYEGLDESKALYEWELRQAAATARSCCGTRSSETLAGANLQQAI